MDRDGLIEVEIEFEDFKIWSEYHGALEKDLFKSGEVSCHHIGIDNIRDEKCFTVDYYTSNAEFVIDDEDKLWLAFEKIIETAILQRNDMPYPDIGSGFIETMKIGDLEAEIFAKDEPEIYEALISTYNEDIDSLYTRLPEINLTHGGYDVFVKLWPDDQEFDY